MHILTKYKKKVKFFLYFLNIFFYVILNVLLFKWTHFFIRIRPFLYDSVHRKSSLIYWLHAVFRGRAHAGLARAQFRTRMMMIGGRRARGADFSCYAVNISCVRRIKWIKCPRYHRMLLCVHISRPHMNTEQTTTTTYVIMCESWVLACI